MGCSVLLTDLGFAQRWEAAIADSTYDGRGEIRRAEEHETLRVRRASWHSRLRNIDLGHFLNRLERLVARLVERGPAFLKGRFLKADQDCLLGLQRRLESLLQLLGVTQCCVQIFLSKVFERGPISFQTAFCFGPASFALHLVLWNGRRKWLSRSGHGPIWEVLAPADTMRRVIRS